MDFNKFNEMFDLEGLKNDLENLNSGGGSFEDVPPGNYEVSIEKLEIGESKKGLPMLKCWFNVLVGEYKGSKLFMNQMLTTSFGIHNSNVFLNTLGVDEPVTFIDFNQYGKRINDIFNVTTNYTYHLEFIKNEKGYDVYKIKEKFSKS